MCDQWSKSEKTKCTLKERLKQVKTELRDTRKLRVDAEKRLHKAVGEVTDLRLRLQEVESKLNQTERTCHTLRAHRDFFQAVMQSRDDDASEDYEDFQDCLS